jgi:predicted ArsR family transcriptional regulator
MAERKDASYHAALASSTRQHVLDALALSSAPLDAQAIAKALALHVTTVRFHLDQLEEAQLVRRQPKLEGRRGRPRMLYTAAASERAEDSREQLIDVLAGALAARDNDDGQSRSFEAGRQWANALAREQPELPDGHSLGLGRLLNVLDELGFEPRIDGADVIQLHACPFRVTARSHPQVVCSVHRGLIEQILETSTIAGDSSARLLPFVEPELCLITLNQAGESARHG